MAKKKDRLYDDDDDQDDVFSDEFFEDAEGEYYLSVLFNLFVKK